MRLTNKLGIAYEVEDFSNCYEAVDKLGEIEDIEGRLGIEISVLLNMQLYGNFYIKSEKGRIEKAKKTKKQMVYCTTPNLGMMVLHKAYRLFRYKGRNYYFKDRGKTWALTKEELE